VSQPLLPLPPTAQDRLVLMQQCLETLSGFLTRPPGHLPTCRSGQWVDGFTAPSGAPCSAKCARTRALVVELRRWLEVP
jgi:hypothetical protein